MSTSTELGIVKKDERPAWLRVVANRDFSLLWAGSFACHCGYWIQTTALSWLAYEKTLNKSFLALVPFLAVLPFMLLGPLLGPLVDRANKKRLLIYCGIGQMIVALFAAYIVSIDNISPTYFLLIALIEGIIGALDSSTQMSSAGLLVPKEDVAAAMPMNLLSFHTARFVGPMIAGLLLKYAQASLCYIASSLAYVLFIFVVLFIKTNLGSYITKKKSYIEDLKEGLLFVKSSKVLSVLFTSAIIIYFFGYHVINMLPALIKEVLHGDAMNLGAAFSAGGIGAVIALVILLATADLPIKRYLIISAVILASVALFLIAHIRAPFLFYSVVALHAFCFGIWGLGVRATSQVISPEHLRGRVLTVDMWVGVGVGTASAPLFGWAAQQTSLQLCFAIAATVVFLAAIRVLLSLKKIRAVDYFELKKEDPQGELETMISAGI